MARLWLLVSTQKSPLFQYSRRVNAELHDSKRTPWSLKRAPALGLKKEGEMLFLQKWRSLSPPRGHKGDRPELCIVER